MNTALKVLTVLLTVFAFVAGLAFVMIVLAFIVGIGAMAPGARGPRIQSYRRY
ncbi:hypothetical protein HS048_34760 [Planomonospora sp. ID91781]|uniref:hypothetical protein n=1 Tax=Planomonospora sp. ID91781 TaxID=2738135 RepID=UPI0018C43CB8|nr:hypothetical protein [Planomonospora sp. ID91781]MBG0825847.1 hypothetical protein [Planomonospora sp. ID91781]